MPRYEFSEGTSNKFWEVQLEGESLVTRYGKIGTDGQTTTKDFDSPAAARKAYDKIVAEKEKKGYELVGGGDGDHGDDEGGGVTSASNPELEAAILKNPDDTDGYVVYGDWLQSQGDPRGELIAVQAALLKKPTDAALLKKEKDILAEHESTFLGSLMEMEQADEELALTWRLGFLDSVSIGGDEYGEIDAEGAYRAVMKLGSAKLIRELKFRVFDTEDGEPDYSAFVKGVAKTGLPAALRSLTFTCEAFQISWAKLGDISMLYPKAPNLEELRIKMGSMKLGKISLPKLKLFEVITGGLTKDNVKSVIAADWPKLETLTLYFGDDSYGANCTLKDIQPILDAKNLKGVRHLGLANAQFADELAAALPTALIMKQLKTLDLSKGTMGDTGAEALIEGAGALKHLEKLDLSQNYISDEVAARLKKAIKGADLSEQGDADEDGDDRYVQVAE